MESDSADTFYGDVAPGAGGPSKTERNWAMGCHLIALCGLLVPNLILGVVGTLVLWLLKRDEGAFVDDQGKEALNFQISLLIYAFVCGVLCVIFIGVLLLVALGLFAFACVIVAAIKASEGKRFRYPMCLRFIK